MQLVDIEILTYKISTITSAFIIIKLIDDKKSILTVVFYIKNWKNKTIKNKVNIKIGEFINLNVKNITLDSYEEKQIIINNENNKYP